MILNVLIYVSSGIRSDLTYALILTDLYLGEVIFMEIVLSECHVIPDCFIYNCKLAGVFLRAVPRILRQTT